MKFRDLFSDEIVRRYFIMNTFDGVLTVIGIIIALMLGGVLEAHIVIMSCVGSGVAMGVSGFWGAYLTERAERKFDVISKGVKKTARLIDRNIKISIIVSLVDGLSPFLAMFLLIIPFLFMPVMDAYIVSFIIGGLVISLLGVFIARIGKDNILLSILKMLAAGIAVTFIIYLLELFKVV